MSPGIQKQRYQAYAMATQTVSKTKQIVLLYDGMIRFVRQAQEAHTQKRIEDRYHLLVKASNVLTGLQGALDFEQGGDVAKILYSYYSSLYARIFSIFSTQDDALFDEIIADIKEMRDVWAEIDSGEAIEDDGEEMSSSLVTGEAPDAFTGHNISA